MAYSIVILDKAKIDIKNAFEYYANIQSNLGRRFIAEIRKKKKHISKYPYASSIKYNRTIVVPISIFPYGLQILILEDKKMVVVLAVICFYQDPNKWEAGS